MTVPGTANLSIRGHRVSLPVDAVGVAVLVAIFLVIAVVVSRISFVAVGVVALSMLGLLAYASWRWPRPMLIFIMLAPLFDRYVVGMLLPAELMSWTRFFSEALLLAAGGVIAARGIREGRFVAAVRHPISIAIAVFLAVAVVGIVVNGVPLVQAAAGLIFTFDALALFYLPRMVGFSQRQLAIAALVFVGVMILAALMGIAQVVLAPDIFGLSVTRGRFGESVRATSFLVDPGLYGVILAMAVGFPLFYFRRLKRERATWIAIGTAFLLIFAVLLSYSRGSWLGLVVGFGLVALLVRRRAFVLAVVLVAVAVACMSVMPRNLLVAKTGEGTTTETPTDIVETTLERTGTIGEGRDLRTLFILNAVPIIGEHPLVGVGPGRYGGAAARTFDTPLYEQYGTDALFWNPHQQTVDNFWLHILVEFGVLGAAAYVAIFVILGLQLLRSAWRTEGTQFILIAGILSMTAVMAVSNITGMLLEGNTASFSMWFFLGAATMLPAVAGARDERSDPELSGEDPG